MPVTTPAIPQPTVAAVDPTSPTTATSSITPPASGGPYATYDVTLCPASGSGTCVTSSCADPTNCRSTGLLPSTVYTAKVRCAVACDRVLYKGWQWIPLAVHRCSHLVLHSAALTQAYGVDARGTATIPSAPLSVAMPSISQPVVSNAVALNPTSATLVITPPSSGGPWTYTATLCPTPKGICVTGKCFDPNNCVIAGLRPGTAYAATVRRLACMLEKW